MKPSTRDTSDDSPRIRSELGRTLRRIVVEPPRGASYGVRLRPRREAVSEVEDDLRLLASRLLAPAPVNPRGVAQTRLLLSDGLGTLFWRRGTDDLRARVREAIRNLETQGS